VTVNEYVPSGLTLVSMAGTGWSCGAGGNTCTRSDTLNPSVTYSAITVTVNVWATASSSVTNTATVSGDGASPQSATDPTTIGSTAAGCGVERWSVKTGTDADSGLVNLNNLTPTTIANLVALPAPPNKPENNRVQPTETTEFTLNATLTQYKLEDDSDYHLVLSDAAGKTMIAEIPSPDCVGSGSPFTPGIANARSEFNARLTATTSFQTASTPVQVKGVGFFDFIHGQTGVALNGIELHPVLDIIFNPTLSIGSLTPAVSSGGSQTLTVTFNAPGGYQSLGVLNVLINTSLDGRQACYLAYSVPDSVLYLVPDSGMGLMPLTLGGPGTVGNSQCSVSGSGSSAVGSGNILSLTLNMTFSNAFGGNRVIYAAARDPQGDNTGWVIMGVHGVPPLPATFPTPIAISPSSGMASNAIQTFTYQDASSADNLQVMWALTNTFLDARGACYVAYYAPGNLILLYPDSGDGSQTINMVLTGTNSVSNSQCTVSAVGSSYNKSGTQASLTLNITFKPGFAGNKATWLAAHTAAGANSDWQALGVRSVPGN